MFGAQPDPGDWTPSEKTPDAPTVWDFAKQSWKDQNEVANFDAHLNNYKDSFDAVNEKIKSATGEALDNPMSAGQGPLTAFQALSKFSRQGVSELDPVKAWTTRVQELQAKHADALDWNAVLEEPHRTAWDRMKAVREKTNEMSRGAGMVEGTDVPLIGKVPYVGAAIGTIPAFAYNLVRHPQYSAAQLAASFAGQMTSPIDASVNLMSFGAGGAAKSILKNAILNASVNAAGQSILSGPKQLSYQSAGLPYGMDVWLSEVAGAAAGGAVLDAGIRGPSRAILRRYGRDVPAGEAFSKNTERAGVWTDLPEDLKLPPPAPVREQPSEDLLRRAQANEPAALRELAEKTGAIEDPAVKGMVEHVELGGAVDEAAAKFFKDTGIDNGEGMRTLADAMTGHYGYIRPPEPIPAAAAPFQRTEARDFIMGNGRAVEQLMSRLGPLLANTDGRLKSYIETAIENGFADVMPLFKDAVAKMGKGDGQAAAQSFVKAITKHAETIGPDRLVALESLHSGRSSPLQIAEAMRRHPDLVDSNVRFDSDLMRGARALAALDDDAFAAMPGMEPAIGAAVADLVPPGRHAQVLEDLAKANITDPADARAAIPLLLSGRTEPATPLDGGGTIVDPAGPAVKAQADRLMQDHAEAVKEATAPLKEREKMQQQLEDAQGELAKLEPKIAKARDKSPSKGKLFALSDKDIDAIAEAREGMQEAREQLTELEAIIKDEPPTLADRILHSAAVQRRMDVFRALNDALALGARILPASTRIDIVGGELASPSGARLDAMSDTETGAITLAAYALDPAARMGHEAVHSLVTLGRISRSEVELAAKASRAAKTEKEGVSFTPEQEAKYRAEYAGRPQLDRLITEEAAAHWFDRIIKREVKVEEASVGYRVRQMVERLRNTFAGYGFRTADDVAKAVLRGDMARRKAVQSWMRDQDLTAVVVKQPPRAQAMPAPEAQPSFIVFDQRLDGADYAAQAMRNLKATSRTAAGVVDTSASAGKAAQMAEGLTGEKAAQAATDNFARVITGIYDRLDNLPATGPEMASWIDQIAVDINKGILKEGALYRADDSPKYPYTAAADLDLAHAQFSEELVKRLNDPKANPIETAAWIEWRANLTDHFWADGVGKTSKALAAIPLMKAGLPLPEYRSNKEFFANASKTKRSPRDGSDSYLDTEWRQFSRYYKTLMPITRETVKVPGYGTPGFEEGRQLILDGQPAQGYGAAMDWIQRKFESYAGGEVKAEKRAVIVLGPPGAGKSSSIEPLAREIGAAVVNADDPKFIFPEFKLGAEIVHEEASALTKRVMADFIDDGKNLIIEKLGDNPKSIMNIVNALKEQGGYEVDIIDVSAPKPLLIERINERAKTSGRDVPEDVLDDAVAGIGNTLETLNKSGLIRDHVSVDTGSGKPYITRRSDRLGVELGKAIERARESAPDRDPSVVPMGRGQDRSGAELGQADRGSARAEGQETGGQPGQVGGKLYALDMSPDARKQRAEAMGFDTSRVWYHGTTSDFDSFGRIDGGNALGAAYYFTEDSSRAGDYAMGENVNRITPKGTGQPNVMPVYLKIRKTFDARRVLSRDELREVENALRRDPELGENWKRGELVKQFDRGYPANGDNVAQGISYNPDEVNRVLQAAGYDSRMSGDVISGQLAAGKRTIAVFDPSNIRSTNAAFDPAQSASSNIMFAFAGEKARTADTDALAIAKQMADEGADREAIWTATGWFTGVDGKWRFEIDDSGARARVVPSNDEGMGPPLSSVMTHDPLYAAYPGMKDIETSNAMHRNLAAGKYLNESESGPYIQAIARNPAEFRNTLLHEGTHHVQYMEGFGTGGAQGADYRRLAGEVEARAVERRSNLSPDERRARPPWEDYDVPEADQIVRFANGENVSMFAFSSEPPTEGPAMRGLAMFAIKAFHGSPHDFDRFDMSKIGTGEGAQAYGHGLYFAESEGVAKSYKDKLGGVGGNPNKWKHLDYKKINDLKRDPKMLDEELRLERGYSEMLRKEIAETPYEDTKRLRQRNLDLSLGKIAELESIKDGGRMYEVNINAHPDDFLDWDKPLSQQSEKVKAALDKAVDKRPEMTGAELYNVFAGSGPYKPNLNTGFGFAEHGTNTLKEKGIPGIKYLDQGSRTLTDPGTEVLMREGMLGNAEWMLSQAKTPAEKATAQQQVDGARVALEDAKRKAAGDVTYNYVVFDESLIEITAKDGQPVTAADRKEVMTGMQPEKPEKAAGAMYAMSDEPRPPLAKDLADADRLDMMQQLAGACRA